ncbi:glycoside hydrolase family 3 C-terminal domain-containing protein [uncultured Streptomyces sp.]|uniref:glycoside hydrolase family 3 C-terminal domain-containing protein n=1 Tax=uncultured Streptomyces sp. TaxID=174707 RepID=UPI00260D91A1|nr:glycoside hydrolase family 3 C-terminal domain-containing protein [uncultured Streptomyces sp.]
MTDHPLPFRDPNLSFERRVDDLLRRLTPDERIAMLHQFAPAVERLGLAAFRTGQEALHGVAWMGGATVFPQAVGLGATWNDELVRRIGEAVGDEVRAKRALDDRVGLNVWSPTVNLLRHPLWGRNEEGYAEDPALTSAIAVAYTRGLRGDDPRYWRTAPVLKHWLAHNNETDRDTASSSVRPRVLHEYDLRAFRSAVRAGAVAGVMPAYNLVNGRPNHVSPLLERELRSWTDQPLVVCSDAGAPSNLVDSEHYFDTYEEATAAALKAGVDSFTDHGTDSSVMTGRVRDALAKGLLDPEDVDTAVRRLLSMRFALGEFDPALDPYAGPAPFDTEEHRALALEAAEQAVVLLKNDGLLPLAPEPGRKIAVVGLLADACKLDWYSGTLLHRSTPLDGLRARFGADQVVFAEGADRVLLTCEGGALRVPEAPAAPDAATATAADGALDPALLTGRTDLPPLDVAPVGTEFALVDWGEGVLTLRTAQGRYLSVADDGHVRASADEPGGWVVQETFRLESVEGHDGGYRLLHIGTGGYVCVAADGAKVAEEGEKLARDRATVFGVDTVERGEDAVARAAAVAHTVVVVAGNDPHINGRETEDRTTLALPPHQDRLWRAAHAANPRTVLALTSAYPYAVPEADEALPALLWTAHGGQAAGAALARILAGDVSPGGRLPQTWYGSDADLPDLLDYDVIGSRQTYQYFPGQALYPFGHGLSYGAFVHSGLTVARDGDTVRAALTVTATGDTTADEVAQLYVRRTGPGAERLPLRKLVAHRRVRLAPGEERRLDFAVPFEELGHWDVAHGRWTVEPGTYEFLAGASSADVRLTATLTVDGEPAGPRPVRERGLEAADYDEQHGTALVDRAKTDGDAVAAAGPEGGRLLFERCAFGTGTRTVTATVSGEGTLALTAGGATAVLTVADAGGPYAYTTVTGEFAAEGERDLAVQLTGSVRLARLAFDGGPAGAGR